MALLPNLFLNSVSCLIVLGLSEKTLNYNKSKGCIGDGELCCLVSDLMEMLLASYHLINVTNYCFPKILL